MKIVFLMALISSPPSDLGPAFQTLCQTNSVMAWLFGFAGEPGRGERLKMIRTGDSPSNNAEQNRTI
jgi:hypothetical protein